MTTAITVTEKVTDQLAVTPAGDGTYTVTHLPTGAVVTKGTACLNCCREAAHGMASMRADWSTLTLDNRHQWFARLPRAERETFERDYWSLTEGCTVTGYAQRF